MEEGGRRGHRVCDVRRTQPSLALKVEEPKGKKCGWPLKTGKGQEVTLPRVPRMQVAARFWPVSDS